MIPNKKKFLIDVVGKFNHGRGGTIALYTLCHLINKLGGESYVTHPLGVSYLNTPHLKLKPEQFLSDDFIIVYPPSQQTGNRYGAKNVVRWVMHKTECASWNQEMVDLNANDLYFSVTQDCFMPNNINYCGLLDVHYIDKSIFNNKNLKREGSVFIIKKGTFLSGSPQYKVHPRNAVQLDQFHKDWYRMCDFFNTSEYFYCYDNRSVWPIIAALCGCISIVVPDPISKLTPEQFYKRSWTNYAGVAYGLSEIERAKKTNKNVEKVIELADEACLKQVDNFMNVCYNYF